MFEGLNPRKVTYVLPKLELKSTDGQDKLVKLVPGSLTLQHTGKFLRETSQSLQSHDLDLKYSICIAVLFLPTSLLHLGSGSLSTQLHSLPEVNKLRTYTIAVSIDLQPSSFLLCILLMLSLTNAVLINFLLSIWKRKVKRLCILPRDTGALKYLLTNGYQCNFK